MFKETRRKHLKKCFWSKSIRTKNTLARPKLDNSHSQLFFEISTKKKNMKIFVLNRKNVIDRRKPWFWTTLTSFWKNFFSDIPTLSPPLKGGGAHQADFERIGTQKSECYKLLFMMSTSTFIWPQKILSTRKKVISKNRFLGILGTIKIRQIIRKLKTN